MEYSFKSIKIRSKQIKGLFVELHWDCAEGVSGDFDEDDPTDEPLLRFDVVYKDEQVDDASYCTNLRIDDDRKLLRKAVETILEEAERSYSDGRFHFKKTGEWLSHLAITDGKLN